MAKKRIVTKTSLKDKSGVVTGKKKTVTKLDNQGNVKRRKEVVKGDKNYLATRRREPIVKKAIANRNIKINTDVSEGLIKPKTAEMATNSPVRLNKDERKSIKKEPIVKVKKADGLKGSVYSKTVEKRGKNTGAVYKSRTISTTSKNARAEMNKRMNDLNQQKIRVKKKQEEDALKQFGR